MRFFVGLSALLISSAVPASAQESPSTHAYQDAMQRMHHGMMIPYTGNADQDFVSGMLPHHQGAVDMAHIELRFGHDPALRRLAEQIVADQEGEMAFMRHWQADHL